MRKKWKTINAKRKAEGKPALNFPLWVKVRNRIAEIPESYVQDVFVMKSSESPCGTAACLAGETIICAAPSVKQGIAKLRRLDSGDRQSRVPKVAAELLGLEGNFYSTSDRETAIFDGDPVDWPEKFREQFYEGKEAQAAVGFLTHVIKTGKVLD